MFVLELIAFVELELPLYVLPASSMDDLRFGVGMNAEVNDPCNGTFFGVGEEEEVLREELVSMLTGLEVMFKEEKGKDDDWDWI